jgi:RNA polymerase sigma factor for flagellar operon FliA
VSRTSDPKEAKVVDPPDVEARVREGLDLVGKVASQLRRHARRVAVTKEDIESYGNEGLLLAARTFDPARGVPFRAWAVFKIRGAMIDGIRAVGVVPRAMLRELRALQAADRLLGARVEDEAGRPCTDAEAADARLQSYLSEIATAMAIALASQQPDEGPIAPTPEERLGEAELARKIREAILRLPDPEKSLVERHYFGDATLEEAARELGLSKSWGSRLHARAIEALTRDMKRNRISE